MRSQTDISELSLNINQDLEQWFAPFRKNIIGNNQHIATPKRDCVRLLYADWTASGRGYAPIEQELMEVILPFIGNTHTESNYIGTFISEKYRNARAIIKDHVRAGKDDVLVSYGSGMTDVLNKFQRMLGLRQVDRSNVKDHKRPVVFITHMEHHSNHTSWLETICEVVVVPPGEDGLVSVEEFECQLQRFPKSTKIASVTACSNVTGIETPYYEIAALMHRYDGYCFVDFACSAPYVEIDMHPDDQSYLDAIFFSPHKFLGGPGATGILVFNQHLLQNDIPDVCGGGTVDWTNPWGGRKYVENVEEREDGGTPAILQTIRAAMALQLKEEMGVVRMLAREEQLMGVLWEGLNAIPGLSIMDGHHRERLGVISIIKEGTHYNTIVNELSDRYGIQVRGGCSCAGTYGHYLLGIERKESKRITDLIDQGDVSQKPGWVRLSIHPTMTNEEVEYIVECIGRVVD